MNIMTNEEILKNAPKGAVVIMFFDNFVRYGFADGTYSKCVDWKESKYTCALRSLSDIQTILDQQKQIEDLEESLTQALNREDKLLVAVGQMQELQEQLQELDKFTELTKKVITEKAELEKERDDLKSLGLSLCNSSIQVINRQMNVYDHDYLAELPHPFLDMNDRVDKFRSQAKQLRAEVGTIQGGDE